MLQRLKKSEQKINFSLPLLKIIDNIILGLSRCQLSVKFSMKEQMESLYKLAKSMYIIHFSALFSASLRGWEIAQSSNTVGINIYYAKIA